MTTETFLFERQYCTWVRLNPRNYVVVSQSFLYELEHVRIADFKTDEFIPYVYKACVLKRTQVWIKS